MDFRPKRPQNYSRSSPPTSTTSARRSCLVCLPTFYRYGSNFSETPNRSGSVCATTPRRSVTSWRKPSQRSSSIKWRTPTARLHGRLRLCSSPKSDPKGSASLSIYVRWISTQSNTSFSRLTLSRKWQKRLHQPATSKPISSTATDIFPSTTTRKLLSRSSRLTESIHRLGSSTVPSTPLCICSRRYRLRSHLSFARTSFFRALHRISIWVVHAREGSFGDHVECRAHALATRHTRRFRFVYRSSQLDLHLRFSCSR